MEPIDLIDDEDDELCVLLEIAPPRFPLKAADDEEVEVLEEIPPPSFRRKRKRKVSDNWRVSLLNKMREMRFLPADQLAVQLRKVKEQKKKKLKEEEVLKKAEKRKRRKEERKAKEQKKKKKNKGVEFLELVREHAEKRRKEEDMNGEIVIV